MSNYNSTLQSNNTDLQAILNQINELPEAGGVDLPVLTNEGSASDLLSGKELIDGDGNVVEGTIPTKTASNLTASGATVTVPAGYYATQATKSVSTATQATPSVTVNSSGLITASATQTAGYVSAGTKSGTKQLTTQAAKTVTPTKSSQTAVASGVYTTGAVTVAAIPSQYITTTDATAAAADIRSGKTAYVNGSKVTGNIVDFDGSYECSGDSTGGSGSGGASVETCTVKIINECVSQGHAVSELAYSYLSDGKITCIYRNKANGDVELGSTPTEIILENIICGSYMRVYHSGYNYAGVVGENGIEHMTNSLNPNMNFKINVENGGTGIITIYDID